MARAESSRSETGSPAETAGAAVSAVENKDSAESFNWKKASEKVDKNVGISALFLLGVSLTFGFKLAKGLLKFAAEAIQHGGKVPNAYKIGQEIFTFDKKGEKR